MPVYHIVSLFNHVTVKLYLVTLTVKRVTFWASHGPWSSSHKISIVQHPAGLAFHPLNCQAIVTQPEAPTYM